MGGFEVFETGRGELDSSASGQPAKDGVGVQRGQEVCVKDQTIALNFNHAWRGALLRRPLLFKCVRATSPRHPARVGGALGNACACREEDASVGQAFETKACVNSLCKGGNLSLLHTSTTRQTRAPQTRTVDQFDFQSCLSENSVTPKCTRSP